MVVFRLPAQERDANERNSAARLGWMASMSFAMRCRLIAVVTRSLSEGCLLLCGVNTLTNTSAKRLGNENTSGLMVSVLFWTKLNTATPGK